MRPPQQKPVMPSSRRVALPVALAQATVASRSAITCASGTLETTLPRSRLKSAMLRDVALAREQLGRDGEIAELGEAPADVLDVLVHAEDLVHDQHDRRLALALGGDRAIARNRTVAVGIWTSPASRPSALVVIVAADDRLHRRANPRADGAGDQLTAGDLGTRHGGQSNHGSR